MPTKYINPESTKELAGYIDSLNKVKSISMSVNQFVKFKRVYDLGFKNNHPTYNDIPILLKIGDENGIVIVELK